MELIQKYFSGLSDIQLQQFEQLGSLYPEWNEKINVISRKDIENLYERHILHSLSLTKVIKFRTGADILDLGTGGGFPGIPLAIFYPNVRFTLVDGTGKKIQVVKEIIQATGLKNVKAQQIRAEELKKVRFDFVVSRAVAGLDKLGMWSFRLLKNQQKHAVPNGLLALKGGDVKTEIKALPPSEYAEIYPISKFFEEAFFTEKCVVYLQG